MPKTAVSEAEGLSEEILTDIELSRISLEAILLRCSRLARLLNDQEAMEWMRQELHGFDVDPQSGHLTPAAFEAALRSGRKNSPKQPSKDGEPASTTIAMGTVAMLESQVATLSDQLKQAFDPSPSLSSNSQFNPIAPSNSQERFVLSKRIVEDKDLLQRIRSSFYSYVSSCNYSLKFGTITQDIFDKTRERVDTKLAALCPTAAQRFISAYDSLRSSSTVDWSNAVHSCRRVLKDMADSLFPATDTPTERGGKQIDLSADKYVNRLMCYIQDHSESETYSDVVGSTLAFIGDRLDALVNAGNKGSHDAVKKDEAERYIIYTYLVVGDILALKYGPSRSIAPPQVTSADNHEEKQDAGPADA